MGPGNLRRYHAGTLNTIQRALIPPRRISITQPRWQTHPPYPSRKAPQSGAHLDVVRAFRRVSLIGLPLGLLLLSAPAMSAQDRQAAPQPAQRCCAISANRAVDKAASASPNIKFENVIQRSKVKFALKNSISPKRYTFETMVGGVALFDYNNNGLLDIFFTNGPAIPSLEKSDATYWNRLYRSEERRVGKECRSRW